MNKKIVIVGVVILTLFVAGLAWLNKKNAQLQIQDEQGKQKQQEQQKFVVDVDPNIDHWQTKETEFFTIKFPKEWFWLGSDPAKHGYPEDSGRENVITNNSSFDVDKYVGIGRGTEDTPLILKDNNEIVISFYGTATSNAGTAQQSIEFWFQKIKKKYAQATCEHLSELRNMPIVADCAFANENHQKVQAYIVANEKNTIFVSVQTTEDDLVQKDILDKIAGNIVLK